jgi:hypothetical protein
MKRSISCRHCGQLEREYQLAIAEIHCVVAGRFNTVGEKLRALFRWQDVRDNAVKAICKHKETHAGEHPNGPRSITSESPSAPSPEETFESLLL